MTSWDGLLMHKHREVFDKGPASGRERAARVGSWRARFGSWRTKAVALRPTLTPVLLSCEMGLLSCGLFVLTHVVSK